MSARSLEALEPEQRPALIGLLGDSFDFTALTELDEAVRVEILEELPTETVAEGVRDLDSDDAVYILEDLDKDDQDEILDQIPLGRAAGAEARPRLSGRQRRPAHADRVHRRAALLDGRPDDRLHARGAGSAGRVLRGLRRRSRLSPARHGLARPAAAHQAPGEDRAIMVSEARHLVRATDDQEEVARLFERYNLVSAAVVDETDRLVGVLTIDDIVDVIQEEADEDIKRLGGVGDEELSDTVWSIARSRFPWLFINLITAVLASSVIGLFEGQLQKMVALAVLMPIVASQGGNAGTQTMTVAVRALATRELGPHNVLRVIGRELRSASSTASGSPSSSGRWPSPVRHPRSRRRHRGCHGDQPGRRGARRHPDSADAEPV